MLNPLSTNPSPSLETPTLNRRSNNQCSQNVENSKVVTSFKAAFFNFRMEADHHQLQLQNKQLDKYLWEKRITPIVKLITTDNPDILGFCELNHRQLHQLASDLKRFQYKILGVRSDNGTQFGTDSDSAPSSENNKREFVGLIFNETTVQILTMTGTPIDLTKNRILVQFQLKIKKMKFTSKSITVLVSHFSDQSEEARSASGDTELNLIDRLNESNTPWISMGDRNWFTDQNGDSQYNKYISRNHVCDFRDDNNNQPLKHYGPDGTFPGHADHLHESWMPKTGYDLTGKNGLIPKVIDVCFRSREYFQGLCSYSYFGGFDQEHRLLTNTDYNSINFEERFLISDHYYIGALLSFHAQ